MGKARRVRVFTHGIHLPRPTPPPILIEFLSILRDRATAPPSNVEWADKRIATILMDWEQTEDPKRLTHAVGLDLPKGRPRKDRTFQAESKIAFAIIDEALAGAINPIRNVAEKLPAELRQVQRVWQTWRSFIFSQLELRESRARSTVERSRIRSAIEHLRSRCQPAKPRRLKPRDRK